MMNSRSLGLRAATLGRTFARRSETSPQTTSSWTLNASRCQRRTLIPAPTANSGPLLERRADRELPSIAPQRSWLRTLPIFFGLMAVSAAAFFNYQKQGSSVVSSTLYALRTSTTARELLGDEIQFASRSPWIRGEMNQLKGRIDIKFWVKGSKGMGKVRFRSVRPNRMGFVSLRCECCLSSEFDHMLTIVAPFSSRPRNGAWSSKMVQSSSSWTGNRAIHSSLRHNGPGIYKLIDYLCASHCPILCCTSQNGSRRRTYF